MNQLLILIISLLTIVNGYAKEIPISDGEYVFVHKFAEHPNMSSIRLEVVVKGSLITIMNSDNDDVFPFGIIDQGEMFWHKKSGNWIILYSAEDKMAEEVGGCSTGPSIVNLKEKVYWTC